MAGLIPRNKIKGVDICGLDSYFYIIRSTLGFYMKSSNFHKGSDLSIHALHPACQHGDHYFADKDWFYIIKGDEYRKVNDLTKDYESSVFTLHPNCRGGDHYLSAMDWFYIIFQGKGVYRRTTDLSKDSDSDEFALHPNCRNGLYYWGLPDNLYFLKPTKWGVQYYKGKDLQKDGHALSVHSDVLNFLPGGLSVTNGLAFSKWVNIKTVSNDSPTPVTWQKKVTKRVGYNQEKLSQITHNWKIAASAKITPGTLTRLIAKYQFSFSAGYEGSSVDTVKENWNEETEEEEKLSFELKPNQRLHVWQYQLGLGTDPVLFCRDLKISDQPNPPTEVPQPPVNNIVDPPTETVQENASTLTS